MNVQLKMINKLQLEALIVETYCFDEVANAISIAPWLLIILSISIEKKNIRSQFLC